MPVSLILGVKTVKAESVIAVFIYYLLLFFSPSSSHLSCNKLDNAKTSDVRFVSYCQ